MLKFIDTYTYTCMRRFVVDSLVDSVERHVQSEQVGTLEQEVAALQHTLAEMQAAADVSDKMFADATALVQEKDELAQALKVPPRLVFQHKIYVCTYVCMCALVLAACIHIPRDGFPRSECSTHALLVGFPRSAARMHYWSASLHR
jgi:hypothetical protein